MPQSIDDAGQPKAGNVVRRRPPQPIEVGADQDQGSDLAIILLQELVQCKQANRVGSAATARLGQLASAAVQSSPEIMETLQAHGFEACEQGGQFRSELSIGDMSA